MPGDVVALLVGVPGEEHRLALEFARGLDGLLVAAAGHHLGLDREAAGGGQLVVAEDQPGGIEATVDIDDAAAAENRRQADVAGKAQMQVPLEG